MRKEYRFHQLSREQREFWEMILMEEIDTQAWYAIACSAIMKEEIVLCAQ